MLRERIGVRLGVIDQRGGGQICSKPAELSPTAPSEFRGEAELDRSLLPLVHQAHKKAVDVLDGHPSASNITRVQVP